MDAPLLHLLVHFAGPMHVKNEIGAEGAIDDQLAAPVTVRTLLTEKVFLCAHDGARDFFARRRINLRAAKGNHVVRLGLHDGRVALVSNVVSRASCQRTFPTTRGPASR